MALGVLFALTLPGLVCLLVLLTALERLGLWARGRSFLRWRQDRTMSGTGLEEMDAFFTGAKRVEMDDRRSRSLLADDTSDGRLVDLDSGIVRITRERGSGARSSWPHCLDAPAGRNCDQKRNQLD